MARVVIFCGVSKSVKKIVKVLKLLAKEYGHELTHLQRVTEKARRSKASANEKAFQVLIGTILSHRTRDERTEIATDALLAKFPTAQALAKAQLAEIRKLVKPVNFYKGKAKYVKKCSQELVERFDGVVPRTMEELTSLTGVGRKTAGCVMVYAHELAHSIPVDSHVHQVSNRLGLVKTKTPNETEQKLMQAVPQKYWLDVNELFVLHGQRTCVPISPFCSRCPVRGLCPRVGVTRSR